MVESVAVESFVGLDEVGEVRSGSVRTGSVLVGVVMVTKVGGGRMIGVGVDVSGIVVGGGRATGVGVEVLSSVDDGEFGGVQGEESPVPIGKGRVVGGIRV